MCVILQVCNVKYEKVAAVSSLQTCAAAILSVTVLFFAETQLLMLLLVDLLFLPIMFLNLLHLIVYGLWLWFIRLSYSA